MKKLEDEDNGGKNLMMDPTHGGAGEIGNKSSSCSSSMGERERLGIDPRTRLHLWGSGRDWE